MTTSTTISFAIPYYKGVDGLRVAIQSVLSQSVSEWKLYVLDDNPEDCEAESVVKSYADKRITFIKNSENLGMVGNWNKCLSVVEGELVTLLHADDELRPNYASLMLELGEMFPDASAYFCRAEIIDKNGKRKFSFPDWYKQFLEPFQGDSPLKLQGEESANALLRGNFIMCPTLCFRLSNLQNLRFDERWSQVQDLHFTLNLLVRNCTIVGSSRVEYRYRRHSQSATSVNTASLLRFEEELELYTVAEKSLLPANWKRARKTAYKKRIIKLNLLFCILLDLLNCEFRQFSRKSRFFYKNF